MGTISITTPSDGQTIDASDVATPLNTIVSEINGSLDSDNITSGGVVPNNLTSGTGTSWTWQSWTPTWNNLTTGNGTITAKYIQIGKTVHFIVRVTLGSTSSVGTSPDFTPPVTADSAYTSRNAIIGTTRYQDIGSSNYTGPTLFQGDKILLRVYTASGTSLFDAGITATVPHTWASTDTMDISGTYEAA